MASALAPNVVRIGPYRDVYEGREAYVAFLAEVVPTLRDYEMSIHRITSAGTSIIAELSETVTDGEGRRLRTDEALLFELDGNLITRVSVYTQKSYRV